MPVARITKSAVDKLPLGGVLWDSDVIGFGVRRHRSEAKHYLLRFRFAGKQTFKRIGTHGSPWTADTARQEARRLLGLIASGVNPSAEPEHSETFGAEVERYLTHKSRGMKPSAFTRTALYLRQHAKPLHQLALTEVDRRRIAQLLSSVEQSSGAATRNRFRATLSAFFNWLVREGLLDTNCVTGTGKAVEGAPRSRVLSDAELRTLWARLTQDQWGNILRLLVLTGQRRSEIADLRWSEVVFDRALIVLPPARTKNSREHSLPLSHQALAILRQYWASGSHKADNDARVFDGLGMSHRKKELDEQVGIAHWLLHDLRRTCATGMAELGVQPHIIEAVLNHVSGHKAGVAGIYNRARYEADMRNALQRWADHLDQITGATIS